MTEIFLEAEHVPLQDEAMLDSQLPDRQLQDNKQLQEKALQDQQSQDASRPGTPLAMAPIALQLHEGTAPASDAARSDAPVGGSRLFASLGLAESLQRAVAAQGYTEMTPIQAK